MKEGIFKSNHLAFWMAPLIVGCSGGNFGNQSIPAPIAILNIADVQLYDYGSKLLDNSSSHPFTVTNTGFVTATKMEGGFTTSAFSFTGGTYPGTGATCSDTLAAGASCTISVSFSPEFSQSYSDSVQLTYFDGVNTQTLRNPLLAGQGLFGQTGALDTTFAGNGAIALGSGTEQGSAVLVQPDRNVIVVGTTSASGNSNFLLARYLPDGTSDLTFGNQGTVTTDFFDQADHALAAALQTDGKIVVVGDAQGSSGIQFAVCRYLSSGALDSTFGNLGKISLAVGASNSGANSVVLDQAGNILVGGYAFTGSNQEFALVRILATGNIDNTFGSSGIVVTPLGSANAYEASTQIDNTGRIVQVGYAFNGTTNSMMAIRYGQNGTVDSSYGSNGIETISFANNADDRAYQAWMFPNGEMLVGGTSTLNGTTRSAVARLLIDGNLDSTFGSSGLVLLTLGTNSDIRGINSGASGPIYVSGTLYGSSNAMVVTRLNWNGTLDSTFASNGTATALLSSGSDINYALTQQTNGKLILVGDATINSGSYLGILRLWP